MNNDNIIKKAVSKSIDDRDRNTKQIIEVKLEQADSLIHLLKNKYIYIPDEVLPIIPDNLTSASTTEEITNKINSIIQALDGWMLRRS
jgi:transcriptional/translational regulatory protein YebC/TACO1